MSTKIIGISAFFHDSAAALLCDDEIIAAAQEERFSRKKHDRRFPFNAIKYCLRQGGLRLRDIDAIVFYEKPSLKFHRYLATQCRYAPQGLGAYLRSMPAWLTDHLWPSRRISRELRLLSDEELPPIHFVEHHLSHACSAFYASPYSDSAILCIDGVGEWATTSGWLGSSSGLESLWEIQYPHSLGLLYSAFTSYLGFKVNSGEYKVMGLAPYGTPKYASAIRDHLIDIKSDGSFKLNMDYFSFHMSNGMTNSRFLDLFNGAARTPESVITTKEMDLAASVQLVIEVAVLRLCRTLRNETGSQRLCMAGGVALNCVANGKIRRDKIFDDVWVQPAAGDAGGALGAALSFSHDIKTSNNKNHKGADLMQGTFLGPEFDDQEIEDYLMDRDCSFTRLDEQELMERAANAISNGNVVGWMQGRMEYGPRALGGRSILGDPRNSNTQRLMNLKIKQRESFRPFAPVVQVEHACEWFEMAGRDPYMLFVVPVQNDKRCNVPKLGETISMTERLNQVRSEIPAVTHVDYSARVQTVDSTGNPKLWNLIETFRRKTGCPVLVNTSFNVRGEPIVCTPEDAYNCFMATEMEYLAIGNCWLSKKDQPKGVQASRIFEQD